MPNFAVNYIASCACRLDKFQEDQEVVVVVIKASTPISQRKKALAEIHTLHTTIDYAIRTYTSKHVGGDSCSMG